jgi:hypothetical protein
MLISENFNSRSGDFGTFFSHENPFYGSHWILKNCQKNTLRALGSYWKNGCQIIYNPRCKWQKHLSSTPKISSKMSQTLQ